VIARRFDPARLVPGVLALAGALVSLTKIGDYDIWHHLRAGQTILDSRAIPRLEPYAYTALDRPFSAQAWLADVAHWLAYLAGGVAGVQLLNAAVIAGTVALVCATIRLRSRAPGDVCLVAALAILAVLAMRFRLTPRPHVFSFLLLAADLHLLQRLRLRGRAPVWLVPILQVVWVNVHGSHILGLVLPGLFLAGEAFLWAFPRALQPDERCPLPPRRLAAILVGLVVANALATTVNPGGLSAFAFPFVLTGLRTFQTHIGEWQPMSWSIVAGYGARYTWAFSALVVLAAVGFVVRRRRVHPTDVLLFAVFGVLTLRAIRLIPELAIATAPGTFAALAPAGARVVRDRARVAAWAALAAIGIAVPTALADGAYQPGLGVKDQIFPSAALAFAQRAGVQGNVFNSFAFGDWLLFHAPDHKVFIHGNNETFPEAFYQDYLAAHRDADLFHRLEQRWDIQWALLEYTLTDYGQREAMPHLTSDPDWVPIYWDRLAVVYVRRSGPNAAIAERLGFNFIRPTRFEFDYLSPLLGRGLAGGVLKELETLVQRAPDNEEAYLSAAFVVRAFGRPDLSRHALEAALAINPRRSATHSALGILALDAGDRATARARFDAALEIDPADPGAIFGLGQLGVKVAMPKALPSGHP